ncbi:GTP-binding protein rhoA [Diaporthe amygdali]|uniref:GTP-binding protein rhoA n=1 Tax=Phomopsis amygdali TaxID=1214568 RepID=UPI0022FE0335|nr:GTP-binding protein rhoA [Diaporthe amygdali]KAJ0122701.1 GTP-binding protein rhoA [Diaporthe amygdali]
MSSPVPSALPGFQPTRKMESFASPWPTPPMRRCLRAQRRLEGCHGHVPQSSQNSRRSGDLRFVLYAPDSPSRLSFTSSRTADDDQRRHGDGDAEGDADCHRPRSRQGQGHRHRHRLTMESRPKSIIGSACLALESTVGKTVADVTNFIRHCRPARADLTPITRELSELQMVLELLNDFGQYGQYGENRQQDVIPAELQAHLRPILSNCITVVLRIDGVLRRHSQSEADGSVKWTAQGKTEMGELRPSLEVHRGALGHISDLISISISRASRNSDSTNTQDTELQVQDVIEDLQEVRSSILVSDSNATLARQHFALQVHLGQIIAYAETLDKPDAWDEAVKTIDATQEDGQTGPSEPVSEPVSPITSIRESPPQDRALNGVEGARGRPKSYSPAVSSTTIGAARSTNHTTTLSIPNKKTDIVSPLTTGGLSINTFGGSRREPGSISPITYGRPAGEEEPTSASDLVGMQSEPISPMSFGKSGSAEEAEEALAPVETPPTDPGVFDAKGEVLPAALIVSGEDAQSIGVAASRVSTAASSYREEEITEEALAFAQVPVHIMGRLSLNLVGHVYTSNSGRSGSDGTSFNRSISTFETDGEIEEAEAEGYAASTGTSDTGSLRDGNLQFSQIDVTQVTPQAAHEPHPGEQLLPQQAAGHQVLQAAQPPPSREIREQASMSTMNTMNTQTFLQGKPLPRTPLVYVPHYPGPFIKKKVVVVGNFSCGKTCLITRMAKGHYPKGNNDHSGVTETVKVSVDEEPVELSLWDIRGIDYDPSWLNNAQVALICFSVNIGSTDAKGKHLGRWVTEVNRNCPGAAIILIGLKSDIRWHAKTIEKLRKHGKTLVTPEQGEQLRDSIGAISYLECSARTGEGVLEVLEEATRVSLLVNNEGLKKGHRRPLSRIGKFLGLGSRSN